MEAPPDQNGFTRQLERFCVCCCVVLLAGCASLPRNATPLEQVNAVTVLGAKDLRAWGGILSPSFQKDVVLSAYEAQTAGEVAAACRRSDLYLWGLVVRIC